jgi:phosphoserine phosphatase
MSDQKGEIVRLRKVLDVTRRMAVMTDLDALLKVIIDAACDVLDCDRASIFLYDGGRNELYSRATKGNEDIRFPATAGIAGAAAMQRIVINVPDAYADPRFNREIDRRTGFRTCNLLTFPLENLSGELVGVLQALNRRNGCFNAEDEELARVLAAQTGVALHRGKLLEEYAEKQRMERDLAIARQIQQSLFPKENPTLPGYEIAGWNRSADETGGDCYDFIPLPDGRLAIFLADATGHGIGAALVIAEARSLVRAMLSITDDLRKVCDAVNRLLAADLESRRFVTAFLGVLDPQRHCVDYVSAGQGPLLHVSRRGVESLSASGVPLAIMEGFAYELPPPLRFEPGDLLLLLTDGFYEAADPAGALFGEERVSKVARRHAASPLSGLIERLDEAVGQFVAGGPQADDLTAVLVRRMG